MKQMDKKDLSKKAKIWFEKAKEWLKRTKEALKKLELKKKYELFKEKLPEDKKARTIILADIVLVVLLIFTLLLVGCKNLLTGGKKQKEEKMDKLAEVAVTEDDCKVCTVLKQNVEAEYLNSCIDFWNEFKEANGEVKGSENGWAAAVEYHIKKVAGQVITQAQISKKYEISPSTLGKRYKDLKIS